MIMVPWGNDMKRLVGVLILLILNLMALKASADIFGVDDRRNPVFGTNEYKLSKSVAVGVLSSLIENNKVSGFDIWTDKLTDYMCKDERFVKQPSIAYACTGFLIGPDLLMTAGHCSSNYQEVIDSSDGYCEAYTWLFDYVETSVKKVKKQKISEDNLYRCKRIVYAVVETDGIGRDFALIQLDRAVTKRGYLTLAKKKARVGEAVSMIGAPMGLPLKVTDNAKVLKNNEDESTFMTDLDAFQGNSGSPVFNRKSEVMGILVGGTPNEVTYKDEKLRCERYNFCDQDGENCKNSVEQSRKNGSDVEKLFKYREIISEFIDFSIKRQTSSN